MIRVLWIFALGMAVAGIAGTRAARLAGGRRRNSIPGHQVQPRAQEGGIATAGQMPAITKDEELRPRW